MSKEEKIKEAYGEYWELVKNDVTENGWINTNIFSLNNTEIEFEQQKTRTPFLVFFHRPISLQGIDNNNSWIDGIPKENGYYFIEYINKATDINEFKDNVDCITWFKLNVKKHQKILFPKQSIF